jgi:hypothetical protein
MPLRSLGMLFVSLLVVSEAVAAPVPRLTGTVFLDAQLTSPADTTSFRFRRVQLTVDHDPDTTVSIRVQLEAEDGTLTRNDRMASFLKQAWLRWRRLEPVGDVVVGLSPTPTWSVSEGLWGYRSIERTILDLQGYGAPVDLGVAIRRDPDARRHWGWHAMVSNGSGPRPETTAGKKFSLSLPYRRSGLIVEVMGDHENESGPRDRWTVKGLLGWSRATNAIGIEGFRRVHVDEGGPGADVIPTGFSVFGRYRTAASWGLGGRFDVVDPNHALDAEGYRERRGWFVLDLTPRPRLHVMPNIAVRTFHAKSSASPTRPREVAGRVTLHWDW